ncbi:MAG TPA: hypothetical protein VMX75_06365 [Spirochaetia bacterium]|nr:hypothetical protein [Spirochaetia bacterium]
MWPFNYGFSIWGTVVLYAVITLLYFVWMLVVNSKDKQKGDKGGT